jgi:hypothetical protein
MCRFFVVEPQVCSDILTPNPEILSAFTTSLGAIVFVRRCGFFELCFLVSGLLDRSDKA